MNSVPIAYVNGQFVPINQAVVSVTDRGFLFGDGVYEVVPVYDKKPFRLGQHLQRLMASLSAVHIALPMSMAALEACISDLIEKNLTTIGRNQSIYLQVTRGAPLTRRHVFPTESDLSPTLFIRSTPLRETDNTVLQQGFSVITMDDPRWDKCHIKSIALMANVLASEVAKQAGAVDTIFYRGQQVLEAASSNVFIVKKGVLMTPPLGPYLLGGITRDLVLELAEQHALPHHEMPVTLDGLRSADEIWLTSSSKPIYPIVSLDGKRVGTGEVGPCWRRMIALYRQKMAAR